MTRTSYRLSEPDGHIEPSSRPMLLTTAVVFCDARRARGESCVVVDRDFLIVYPAPAVAWFEYGEARDA